ncbi:MAG: exodeoxyribonuclease VII large subunit [Clostridiales bacterium]|nr:exodeoxyribonuclease VII large subunit [Clostridiales bacterium]
MQASALSVSDLNEYVRRSLAGDPMLQGIAVRGEVSNFRPYASGHWYFSLKDENSRIACVMFRQHNMGLRFKPQDGMKVVLIGSAGLYTVSGSYQFYAEAMLQDGVGELFQRYNALKDKLLKEGLFDAARKRPLPLLPRAMGIVTSGSGAVLHDILTVAHRRFANMPLILRPAQVQGEGAAEDLVQALHEVAQLDTVDVIIIGRGGGSIEDLWAFNEEKLVRAIAACPKPVISAVGHETDTTLADFAADMRAPTPSAAAELAVPDKRELNQRVRALRGELHQKAMNSLLMLSARMQDLARRLERFNPAMRLQGYAHRLAVVNQALLSIYAGRLREHRAQLDALMGKLQAMGPGETLRRGYALALHEGRPLTDVSHLPEQFTLVFHDGRAEVRKLSAQLEEFK